LASDYDNDGKVENRKLGQDCKISAKEDVIPFSGVTYCLNV